MSDQYRDDPITGVRLSAGMSVDDLVEQYARCGINASAVAEAVDVTHEMLQDEDCTVLMSVAGPMVPGGLREVIADVIEQGWVDGLVTTGATLTHDTIEAIGGHHHHGSSQPPDVETSRREYDEALREAEIDRIYNVYLPQEHFETFEYHCWEHVFPALKGDAVSIQELTRRLGEANATEPDETDAHPGITATAAEHEVPIFCPAIQDSILGLQAWLYGRTHDFTLDALADMTRLSSLANERDRAGCFLVAGGVPKNFTLQTKLVTPGAYAYAVQFTTDPEATGGLSGASLDEARSWGKLERSARNTTVWGDATVTVPLVLAATYERIEG